MAKKPATPPSAAQQKHAQKITHRDGAGQFKPAPSLKPPPPRIANQGPTIAPSLDQDPGGGYNPNDDEIQQ